MIIQARNHMSNMKVGDKAFFYHSNCKKPGIVGIVEVSFYNLYIATSDINRLAEIFYKCITGSILSTVF